MKTKPLSVLAVTLFGSLGANAATTFYDANVTNNVIFGTGNPNGFFTVSRDAAIGLEIGLRAKIRNTATYNSDGDGTYHFGSGAPTWTAGWVDGNTPAWNFDWSVNTNYNGFGTVLGSYSYRLSLDADPTVGVTDFLTFDPITGPNPNHGQVSWDHGIGDNTSTYSTDVGINGSAALAATYAGLLSNYNLAQNSWNYEFFDAAAPLSSFLRSVPGEYEIKLEVSNNDFATVLGSQSIFVVIPEPSLALGGILCIAGLGIRRRSR